MALPHWFGFRTTILKDSSLQTVGRNYAAIPLAILMLLTGLGIPVTFAVFPSANISNSNAITPVLMLLLLLVLGIGGAVYCLFYMRIERRVIFNTNGSITIADKTVLKKRLAITVKLSALKRVDMRISRPSRSAAVCYSTLRMQDGNNIGIDIADLPMYAGQGRKLHAALKDFFIKMHQGDKLGALEG